VLGDATLLGDARNEIRLDLLLDEMLASRRGGDRRGAIDAPASIIELRDTARRLRAASQWSPLPEGRLTVRQALLVATQQGAHVGNAGRAAWRRASVWLSGTAIVAILTVWTFAAGMGDRQPVLGPAHALRLVLERSQLALAPHPARYALSYDFPAIQLPAGSARTSIQGRVGGLPVTLSVTPATGTCAPGTACGTFTVAPTQLPDAAGAKFGTMSGTFGCGADGACTFAFAEMTGVFATIEQPTLSMGAIGQRHGRLTTKLASLKDWVSTVASAGQKLQAEALLPAGLTVKDLTTAAAANGAALHDGGGGQSTGNNSGPQNSTNVDDTRGGGSPRRGSPASSPTGAGAAAGPKGGAVQPGPGARSSTPGGPHSTRRGEPHSAPAGQDRVHTDGTNVGVAGGARPGASHSADPDAGQANGASPRGRHGLNATRDRDPASPSASSGDDDRGPANTGQREVNHNERTGSGVHDSGHRAGSAGQGSTGGGGAGGGRTTSVRGKSDRGKGNGDKADGDKGDGDKGDGDKGDGGKGDGGKGDGGSDGGGKGGGGKGGGG
jgi:hypothetical protein